MTPAARIEAAIGILDRITGGAPAEKALLAWARRSRFAGSGDRAAIRDLVFQTLRRRRSWAWLGGGEDGRALMLGHCREAGIDPDVVFCGARHAPGPLSRAETAVGRPIAEAPLAVRLDLPDWILPDLEAALAADFVPVCERLRSRAPVHLRANLLKTDRATLAAALASAGFEVTPHPLSDTALAVRDHPRRLAQSPEFAAGGFEFQDAASQAAVQRLVPHAAGREVLDYCAGGGGKALALAAAGAGRIVAHDANRARMKDLPARAARAGARVETSLGAGDRFDLVLCDAPCSGTGAWRRQPEGKWRLTRAGLDALTRLQDRILAEARDRVRPGGALAYATCSLLDAENARRIAAFLRDNPAWEEEDRMRLTPLDGGDGFFLSVLRAPS